MNKPETAGPAEADQRGAYQKAFWLAVLLTLAAYLVPYGQWVIYPFAVLATWAHEMGHGLAALLVGGSFHKLEMMANLSGVATTATGGRLAGAAVSAGGLVGAPICGGIIIALGPKRWLSRAILALLALVLALSLLLWVRNLFGALAVAGWAAVLGLAAWKLGAWWRFILVQVLGVQLSLSALKGWRYLFTDEAVINGRSMASDVSAIADALVLPYWFWGALLTIFNLAVLMGAYYLALRSMMKPDGSTPGEVAK